MQISRTVRASTPCQEMYRANFGLFGCKLARLFEYQLRPVDSLESKRSNFVALHTASAGYPATQTLPHSLNQQYFVVEYHRFVWGTRYEAQ